MPKPSDKELKKMSKAKGCKELEELSKDVDALEQIMQSVLNNNHNYGKTIEELEKEIAILKSKSHPPAFTEDDMKLLKKIAAKMGM